jgi:hypothetical protein
MRTKVRDNLQDVFMLATTYFHLHLTMLCPLDMYQGDESCVVVVV